MSDSQEKWNADAAVWQQVYSGGLNDYNFKLLSFLRGLCPVSGARVLDIGCGVGKYGIALARLGYEVTLTDFSPRMIEFAKINAQQAGVSLTAVCADWNQISGNETWLKDGFDLVLSTMSPAVHDRDTLHKMLSVSRGVCLIACFLDYDPVTVNQVTAMYQLPPVRRFAESEADFRRLLEELRSCGQQPMTKTVPYSWADLQSAEEFIAGLQENYGLPLTDEQLSEAVRRLAEPDGTVRNAVRTDVIWCWWNTEKEFANERDS